MPPQEMTGVGLRSDHYSDWFAKSRCPVPHVEAITENFLGRGGRARDVLQHVRHTSELIFHGVSLSLGGFDPLDLGYLRLLRELASDFEALHISDHLCFGRVDGISAHDLWPMTMNDESLTHVASRIRQAQDVLGRRIAIENVSSYVRFRTDSMTESVFLSAVADEADCLLLVDVNNIVVSAHNHGFSASEYVDKLDPRRVAYMHVAGHSKRQGYRFDDHASLPDDEVLGLLSRARERFGEVPCIFEWDENIPSLDVYVREAQAMDRRSSVA